MRSASLVYAVRLGTAILRIFDQPLAGETLKSAQRYSTWRAAGNWHCGAGSWSRAYEIKRSSFLALPPLVAATIQRGIRPRTVQVFPALSRYFTATLPRDPLPLVLRPNNS